MSAVNVVNVAVIFAGGVGRRMHSGDVPKQFLRVHGKPIIAHTLEIFQNHPGIDGIVISCVAGWVGRLEEIVASERFDKVRMIVEGGETGQDSIYNALCAVEEVYGAEGVAVLIHDGVRPLVDAETIWRNIDSVVAFGSAVTCVPAKETVVETGEERLIQGVMERSAILVARAPQSFWLDDVLEAHRAAREQGRHDFIDSCTLMDHFGYQLATVMGGEENVKVTTPDDYYMLRAVLDAREDAQFMQSAELLD